MKPTPDEIVASLRSLLRQHIAPELSPEGQVHLRRIQFVLRDGRWSESAFDLMHENRELARLLGECSGLLAQVSGDDVAQAQARRIEAALGDVAARGEPRSFAQANATNHALREALAGVIEAMRAGALESEAVIASAIITALAALQARAGISA